VAISHSDNGYLNKSFSPSAVNTQCLWLQEVRYLDLERRKAWTWSPVKSATFPETVVPTISTTVTDEASNRRNGCARSTPIESARVDVRVDAEFSARYPQQLSARITVHTKDGRELKREKFDYEGSLANPMSWARVVEKFHWLSEAYADKTLRRRIIEVVQTLDERPLSDLMCLLAAVKPVATYASTHPGFQ
jgi:hypothetical protein